MEPPTGAAEEEEMRKRIGLALGAMLAGMMAATPGRAAVDLLQRLQEKGIITEQERQELAKEESKVETIHKGSFAWSTEDGRFRTQLYGYGQVRYTFQDNDQSENTSNFSVQRARLGVRGNAFLKDLKYQLYLNIYSGNEKDVSLFDWFVDYTPLKELGVKAGQYKVPYGVQWNTSAASLQFVDRSTVDGDFRLDRDTGLTLHGTVFDTLTYDAGVFNGEGTNKNNPNDKMLWVGQLTFDPLGKFPSAESDIGISKSPLVRLTGGVAYDDDVSSHSRSNLNNQLKVLGASDVTQYDAFAGLMYMGASVRAEYYWRKIAPRASSEDNQIAAGFYAQGGFFVWRDKLEVAARYEYFNPNFDVADDLTQEYGAAVNYYFFGQRNKIQTDFFRINNQEGGADSQNDNRWRVQYQLAF
jgi:phosphate-selective porin OprO/OprP